MTWGEESDEQGMKFRDVLVPPGAPDPDGELLKTRLVEPVVDPLAPEGRSTARDAAETTGEGWRRELRPRHRDIVKKYFGGDSD